MLNIKFSLQKGFSNPLILDFRFCILRCSSKNWDRVTAVRQQIKKIYIKLKTSHLKKQMKKIPQRINKKKKMRIKVQTKKVKKSNYNKKRNKTRSWETNLWNNKIKKKVIKVFNTVFQLSFRNNYIKISSRNKPKKWL